MLTEVRVSVRTDLDAEDGGDGSSAPPMDVALEMAMAETLIAVETVSEIIVEPMERNENGKWRRRNKAPVTA
jgi:hypothetical protein